MTVEERLLKYVSYWTTSDENSTNIPSSKREFALAELLEEELNALHLSNVTLTDHCYVYGLLPATKGMESKKSVGFISHIDTAPDFNGKDVKPQIINNYDGGDVLLEGTGEYLKVSDFPTLSTLKGRTLITTDGTSLLGADDKAGVAEILTAAQTLLIEGGVHATLKIGFTPDEEIGRGADQFDVAHFGADYAYTADGGTIGELEYENFNAASAKVTVHGLNIHPGSAKNKMVNSQYIAMEFQSLLPQAQKPEYTENYEGFIHLTDMKGEVERSILRYIVRDHDKTLFEEKKQLMTATAEYLNRKYGDGTVELELKDSYYNMREKIEPHMEIVDRAKRAMAAVGMEPRTVPVRGGTDGARLSYEGLLCPNLCTGGENYHGRFEYIPVEDMEKCVAMLVALLRMA